MQVTRVVEIVKGSWIGFFSKGFVRDSTRTPRAAVGLSTTLHWIYLDSFAGKSDFRPYPSS
jgi:hypothetical protein